MNAREQGTPKPAAPVVVSSITGKPIELKPSSERIVPQRAAADLGNDSNDARLLGDVPPHWGK